MGRKQLLLKVYQLFMLQKWNKAMNMNKVNAIHCIHEAYTPVSPPLQNRGRLFNKGEGSLINIQYSSWVLTSQSSAAAVVVTQSTGVVALLAFACALPSLKNAFPLQEFILPCLVNSNLLFVAVTLRFSFLPCRYVSYLTELTNNMFQDIGRRIIQKWLEGWEVGAFLKNILYGFFTLLKNKAKCI